MQPLLLNLGHDLCEDGWVFQGNGGQDLAIQFNVRFLQSVDEAGVAHAVFAGGGVQADGPERAEVALLLLAALVGVHPGLQDGGARQLYFRFASPLVPLGLGQEIAAALCMHYSSFDSGHISWAEDR